MLIKKYIIMDNVYIIVINHCRCILCNCLKCITIKIDNIAGSVPSYIMCQIAYDNTQYLFSNS